MSLIFFHRLLIGTAILFCLGFAVWEIFAYRRSGGAATLLLALAFAAAGVGLGYYLRHLRRFLKLPGEDGRLSR